MSDFLKIAEAEFLEFFAYVKDPPDHSDGPELIRNILSLTYTFSIESRIMYS